MRSRPHDLPARNNEPQVETGRRDERLDEHTLTAEPGALTKPPQALPELPARLTQHDVTPPATETRLQDHYPDLMDLPDDDLDTSAWADGPLTGNVMGPFFYFALTYSGAEEALAFVAETARTHGLVCFDPQRPGLLI